MNKTDVTRFFKNIERSVSRHSPEILTGVGIAGMVTTVVLAVKATPKALELIAEEEKHRIKEATIEEAREWSDKGGVPIKPVDYVKLCWKPYIPAAVTGVVSVACIVGANSVHARRNAALYSAYKISTTALTEYRDKVVETIGEKKEHAIRDKVAKDKMEKNPVNESTVIITGGGETLCYDSHSDRYFYSDIDNIKRSVNELNHRMTFGGEMYISLNDFYDEIGLKHTEAGDNIGWRPDKGLIDIRFGTQLTDKNKPCIVIDHLIPPEYDFDKLY